MDYSKHTVAEIEEYIEDFSAMMDARDMRPDFASALQQSRDHLQMLTLKAALDVARERENKGDQSMSYINPGPNSVFCAACEDELKGSGLWMRGNMRSSPVVPPGAKVLASNAVWETHCPRGHVVSADRREEMQI